jgi:hypothetical protein
LSNISLMKLLFKICQVGLDLYSVLFYNKKLKVKVKQLVLKFFQIFQFTFSLMISCKSVIYLSTKMFNFSFLLKSAAKELSFMFSKNCEFFLFKSIASGQIIYLFYFFKLFIKLKFLFLLKKEKNFSQLLILEYYKQSLFERWHLRRWYNCNKKKYLES